MSAQAQRRDAEPRAGGHGDHDPRCEAGPEGQVIVRRPEADAVGAKREKRGLREIDLAAQPEHYREAERGERHARDGEEAIDGLALNGAARSAHAFSATRSPNTPCGRRIRNRMSTRKAKASLNGTEI